jgi:undecaprenyl diphosphate synthase
MSSEGSEQPETNTPRHVAIIMDGNGRWAQRRNLPRPSGHKAGVRSVRMVVEESARQQIEVLTLFAFSSENWQRPQQEVGLLMELFLAALRQESKRLRQNNVRLRVIGDTSAFSEKLQRAIRKAEEETAGNGGLLLQIAANYGGRWDIIQAARSLAAQVQAGELAPEGITEETFSEALSFFGVPEPDLFIRTGGEQRISNFLLWQLAYTELYFTETLWPDFDAAAFRLALMEFGLRQRRFGLTGEQVNPNAASEAD